MKDMETGKPNAKSGKSEKKKAPLPVKRVIKDTGTVSTAFIVSTSAPFVEPLRPATCRRVLSTVTARFVLRFHAFAFVCTLSWNATHGSL